MNYKKGQWVIFSYGIMRHETGLNSVFIGQATGNSRVRYKFICNNEGIDHGKELSRLCSPDNVFYVSDSKEDALKVFTDVSMIWNEYNSKIKSAHKDLFSLVNNQIKGCIQIATN